MSFTLPQILPITHCQLYINWIQYWSGTLADKHTINETFELTSEEESKSIRRINRFWNGCGACRCGNKANLTDEKKEIAWKEYPELKADFDSLKRLLSEAKKIKLNLSTCNNTKRKKELIAVPINCYFDKGFYAAIYYTKGCEILKIQLSAGKSAIQCIIGVDKDNLDLLAYLYYCTIAQRTFFQYMTEEQKNLKDYLENTHPIMKLYVNGTRTVTLTSEGKKEHIKVSRYGFPDKSFDSTKWIPYKIYRLDDDMKQYARKITISSLERNEDQYVLIL